jgi:hypothetical protein
MEQEGIDNGIFARDPRQFKERPRSWQFVNPRPRRSQNEGRIGIIIHNFLDSPIRGKGFARRQLADDWAVLTLDLWVLACLPQREVATKKEPSPARKAAARAQARGYSCPARGRTLPVPAWTGSTYPAFAASRGSLIERKEQTRYGVPANEQLTWIGG